MELPKTIYHLVLQDAGRELKVVADILSATPFPRIEEGDMIQVNETDPSVWDVKASTLVIHRSDDGKELHVRTGLVVASPCTRSENVPKTF